MKPSDLVIDEIYTYTPPKENAHDNRHFPAKVEAIGKRIKVRIFMEGAEAGVIRVVSPNRLSAQGELLPLPNEDKKGANKCHAE